MASSIVSASEFTTPHTIRLKTALAIHKSGWWFVLHLRRFPNKICLFIYASMLVMVSACSPEAQLVRFSGETMGTTYAVTYLPVDEPVEKPAIDELLKQINRSLSTYDPTSAVSRINASTDTTAWYPVDTHFEIVFVRSQEINRDSGGAFNPAVGPLVDAWGFGPDGTDRELPTEDQIRALLDMTRLEVFELRHSPPAVRKSVAGARLDFSAIAKGYGVDAVGAFLERNGVKNYLVEIGGEVRARGHRGDGRSWEVGIERPVTDPLAKAAIEAVVPLENAAMATSGNYRSYRVGDDGQTYSHILDPATGHPERSSLLSVSVIAGDAMTADAYATALMVMGADGGVKFVEGQPGFAALFISSDGSGGFTSIPSKGFPAYR